MNGIRYLFDTCFLIELYRRNHRILAIIAENQIGVDECAISRINRIEVLGYTGLSEQDEKELTNLLGNFYCFPIDDAVEKETISLRKKHKIKLPDAMILATANVHDLQLLTLDKGLLNKFS